MYRHLLEPLFRRGQKGGPLYTMLVSAHHCFPPRHYFRHRCLAQRDNYYFICASFDLTWTIHFNMASTHSAIPWIAIWLHGPHVFGTSRFYWICDYAFSCLRRHDRDQFKPDLDIFFSKSHPQLKINSFNRLYVKLEAN